ncbi:MAG: hypothetical protein KF894_07240 [Labilithrix sp.]|nr:hypothetical protein [Labilithrix sp.]
MSSLPHTTTRRAALVALAALVIAGCSRAAPDATPEGVVRLWLEKMESSADDGRAMKEAYALLGPRARANLKERADRASRGQGRRYEPHEMLAEGRFGLRFRPKSMTAKIEGDDAWVEVRGDGADQHATVKCTREGSSWRIEPDLPDVLAPARREGG